MSAATTKRFRRRHSEIEAVQYLAGMHHKQVRWIDGEPRFMCGESSHHTITPGDWIVTDPAGDGFYVVRDEVFKRRYEAM